MEKDMEQENKQDKANKKIVGKITKEDKEIRKQQKKGALERFDSKKNHLKMSLNLPGAFLP